MDLTQSNNVDNIVIVFVVAVIVAMYHNFPAVFQLNIIALEPFIHISEPSVIWALDPSIIWTIGIDYPPDN